ncbi:hypothetical protein N9A45_01875 [bacterium]|nr:hypothetical protein [bacterium]
MSYHGYVPDMSSFLHAPYTVVDAQVKYVVGEGMAIVMDARDYQKTAVLELHAERQGVLKFQADISKFEKQCQEWSERGFVVPKGTPTLPLKKVFTFPGRKIQFQLEIQDKQEDGEVHYENDGAMWFLRKSFYTMTRQDKSTATLVVVETLEK